MNNATTRTTPDQFARRFTAVNGGAKDLYDVKHHVQHRGHGVAPGSIAWFFAELRAGRYTTLGSYPKYFVTADGGTLSFDACLENALDIGRAIRGDAKRADVDCARFFSSDPELRVIGCQVNWENPELFCDITGARIESAYAEDLARDADLSRGFDAGNYDAAYVSEDFERALRKRGQRSEAYHAAYVLGFFSSFERDEMGGDGGEAFDEALASEHGQRCVELGYVDRE